MTFYKLSLQDQPDLVWLIHNQDRKTGAITPLPEYQGFVCPSRKCGKFSYDEVFKFGFASAAMFKRAKGDLILTRDGFYCVSEKFREVIHKHGFPGLSFQRIGTSGWYVINVLSRFEISCKDFQKVRGPCDMCGRLREVIGSISHMGRFLNQPKVDGFFTTEYFREGSAHIDRDIFATKAVAETLKAEGIKGGLFGLIPDAETYAAMCKANEEGTKFKAPKNCYIFLK